MGQIITRSVRRLRLRSQAPSGSWPSSDVKLTGNALSFEVLCAELRVNCRPLGESSKALAGHSNLAGWPDTGFEENDNHVADCEFQRNRTRAYRPR